MHFTSVTSLVKLSVASPAESSVPQRLLISVVLPFPHGPMMIPLRTGDVFFTTDGSSLCRKKRSDFLTFGLFTSFLIYVHFFFENVS